MTHRIAVILGLSLLSLGIPAGAAEDYPVELFSLPPQAEVLLEPPVAESYRVSFHVNPYYLQSDLDGDHETDTAVLVRHKETGKTGIAIVDGSSGEVVILGAGNVFGDGDAEDADDFEWLDAWFVYPRGPVYEGVEAGPPPVLAGDAILAMKSEASSGLFYWTGSEYAWYQQGD